MLFRLYTKKGCHLCEDMENQLKYISVSMFFELERVDIDDEPDAYSKYASVLPVLTFRDEVVCESFFDLKTFEACYNKHRDD